MYGGAERNVSPEKHRGMEMRNHRARREKNAPSGMAPLLPVWTIKKLSRDMISRVMPGKYAAHLHATLCQPSKEWFNIPQSQTLE